MRSPPTCSLSSTAPRQEVRDAEDTLMGEAMMVPQDKATGLANREEWADAYLADLCRLPRIGRTWRTHLGLAFLTAERWYREG